MTKFYPICNLALIQLFDKVNRMSLQNVRTLRDMIKNFLKVTEDLQTSIGGMLSQLKDCPIAIIDFLHVVFHIII